MEIKFSNMEDVMDIKEQQIIVIAGPTASGKTDTAIEVAKRIDGEIISADSMQVYKYMDIGTAKPSMAERQGIPHYLIDVVYPDEAFSVAEFCRLADRHIQDIQRRGKTPIICGGTGFYIKALLGGVDFSETETDTAYREELYKVAEEQGAEVLHGRLNMVDPEAAAAIHANNIKRVVRALEYYHQTGKPISHHNEEMRNRPSKYKNTFFYIDMSRELLYNRINIRVDRMIDAGLAAEVEGLLGRGYGAELVSMQGLGYKEIVPYLLGKCTLEEAVLQLKTSTRRFAKRQITWFINQHINRGQGILIDSENAAESVIGYFSSQ